MELNDEQHGYSLGERLRAIDLDDEARKRLGRHVIVTRDGSRLFLYTTARDEADEAARVVRQLLIESTLLACTGGVLGLALTWVGVRLFDSAVSNVNKPYWIVFSIDPWVFAYFAGICVATGVIFGLAPALQVSRANVNATLNEGGRGNAGTVRTRRLASRSWAGSASSPQSSSTRRSCVSRSSRFFFATASSNREYRSAAARAT